MTINYVEKGVGLHDAISAAGHSLVEVDRVWVSSDDEAVQAIIDAYDPLPGARADLSAAVAAERIRRQQLGAAFIFPDAIDGTIQTRNEQDLLNVNGLTTRAIMAIQSGVTGPVFPFRDQENRTHMMTPAQILELGVAASDFVSSLYQAKWAHDAAIAAWDGSQSYDLTALWPET